MSTVQLFAHEYFRNINPIAARISTDIATTKEAYEDLWHTLNQRDKTQIIDETIIHPKVLLKYSLSLRKNLPDTMKVKNLSRTGSEEKTKVINGDCQDEHSGPFSWFTRSQLDLSILDDTGDLRNNKQPLSPVVDTKSQLKSEKQCTIISNKVTFIDPPTIVLGGSTAKLNSLPISSDMNFPSKLPTTDNSDVLHKLKDNVTLLKIHSKCDSEKADYDLPNNNVVEKESLVKSKTKYTLIPAVKMGKQSVNKSSVSKPKNPPPPPPVIAKTKENKEPLFEDVSDKKSLLDRKNEVANFRTQIEEKPLLPDENFENFEIQLSGLSKGSDVPKTGFDFLDDW